MTTGYHAVPTTRRLAALLVADPGPRDLLQELGAMKAAAELDPAVTTAHLLSEARHQADVAQHPYVDEHHVRLAAARLTDDHAEWTCLSDERRSLWPVEGWRRLRPRGRKSAARCDNRAALRQRHREAVAVEAQRPWSTGSGLPT